MFVIAAVLAVGLVLLWQYRRFRKHAFEGLKYSATFSSSEVTAGEYVYVYEEIANTGKYPITYLKADTELPEGLVFTLMESTEMKKAEKPEIKRRGVALSAGAAGLLNKEKDSGKRKVRYVPNVQSLFAIRPGIRIRRRWRVYCGTRGEYRLNGVLLTQGDVLGFDRKSIRIEPEANRRTVLTVLPVPVSLADNYTSSRYICGDIVSNLCPVTDPQRICGSREYTTNDPMNRVNWKSTAVHGKLMVNIEEKTVRQRFAVLLNLNSREIESNPAVPSDRGAVEKCITVCASILDRMAAEDIPVQWFCNSLPSREAGTEPVSDDETGCRISKAGHFRGKRDMIFALRTLATLGLNISLPADKMFDHIAAHPELYREDENLVIVSAYLDARMVTLHRVLAAHGVNVSFYITTTRNVIGVIPEDMDVYFSLF